MDVSTPLSSRKTSRAGSTSAQTSARQASLAAATLGRVCSEACKVFFARQAQPGQRPADRRLAEAHPGALGQAGAILRQRRIILLRDQLGQDLRIRPTQRASSPSMCPRTAAAFAAGKAQPPAYCANADSKPLRQHTLAALAGFM